MSGSIAAIAAYNSTGTQGHGTVDEYEQGVKSVFWNDYDTDKHFVNGCSVSEVSSNKGSLTDPETIVFTFDNDIDAISDLEVLVEVTGARGKVAGNIFGLPTYFIALLIERIEVCIGNQVISTINTAGLLKTYLDIGGSKFYRQKKSFGGYIQTIAQDVSATFKLPIFNTLENDVDCSYLMGLANNQTLQVKVYPQNFSNSDMDSYASSAYFNNPGSAFEFKLFANKCTMTNAERDLLKNQVVSKRTNITQSATRTISSSESFTPSSPLTINCDHFNIYADALYVVACEKFERDAMNNSFSVEVFLNSSSYSGILPPEIAYHNTSLLPPWGRHASNNTTDGTLTQGGDGGLYYYKIPLSNSLKSKDQDYVPLGKYDSIRVVLTPTDNFTMTNLFKNTLSVIATGKTTGLYQNGAVTFSTF